jgi:ketosteroid isomerase-like protein
MKHILSKPLPVILILGAIGLVSGCASNGNTKHTDSDPRSAAKTLMRLDDEWSASAQKRDVEKVASFYADDAIAYPPGEPAARGKDAAKKVWAAYLADPSFAISWKSDDARVSDSGEIGYTAGTYDASFNGPDGKKVIEKGKFLCVWQKQPDGSWKAIRDMWNTDTK